jgi:hypothetical protein
VKRLFLAFLLLLAGPAAAQGSDDALEAALAHWRAASWYARIGDVDVAALELEEFRGKWQALAKEDQPPASHASDPHWRDIAREVAHLAGVAAAGLERKEAPVARTALAGLGDVLAQSRGRSGVTGFPAALRRYRDTTARLIDVMATTERFGMGPMERPLHERVQVLAREAASGATALVPVAPPRWANDEKFQQLLKQNVDGARNLAAAMDRAQPLALGLEVYGLIGVLRANYNLLFLGYGY